MSYPGSKAQAGVWQRIIGQMPPHSVYVEPFFGSGQVFHRKRRAALSIVMDTDAALLQALPHIPGRRILTVHGNALFEIPYLFLTWQGDVKDTLIYCDPPYPLSTRAGRVYYEHEMTDEDHAALLSTLLQLKCRVMISSYPNALYVHQLREWRCVRYQTMTRGGKRTECLWCNFPEPEVLHDWRYAGRNFRERCALKRVETRWLAKLDAMTPRKRGYVLNAIQQRILAPEVALSAGNAGNDAGDGGLPETNAA